MNKIFQCKKILRHQDLNHRGLETRVKQIKLKLHHVVADTRC